MVKSLLIYANEYEKGTGKAFLDIEIKDENNQKVIRYIRHEINSKDKKMEAAYEAFIDILFNAYILQAENIRFMLNNKKFVEQLNRAKIKNRVLKPMHEQARKLSKGFKDVKIEYFEPLEEKLVMAS